jgi:NifU-like protein involved in Fe-S cluster formation
MLYREIIAVCSEIHTKHINTLCGQNVELYIKTHSVSVIKTSQLMLYKEIIAVCSAIHTKHVNTVCGQNVEVYIKTQSVRRSKHTPSRL